MKKRNIEVAAMGPAEDAAIYSRANPNKAPVRVVRAWPGVRNGQLVVLRPDRERRLMLGGFVEPA